jgi:hypothetical protein
MVQALRDKVTAGARRLQRQWCQGGTPVRGRDYACTRFPVAVMAAAPGMTA